jgi:acetate kinase
MAETILVVNAGSSSLKFKLFEVGADRMLASRLEGKVDGVGSRPRLRIKAAKGGLLIDETYRENKVRDLPEALALARDRLTGLLAGRMPIALGHRVVHGGPLYSGPVLVDDDVLAALERAVPFAPLHQPNNLAPIKALRERAPDIPQVACFDTAFHRDHPAFADRYAIPESLHEEGVRRYGFHGLSYEYVAGRLKELAPDVAAGRVVVAHLGSGASMCAIKAGRSIDSTMGFTALDGLPMGTRSGQIDPGVVLYLLTEKRMKAKAVEQLLYHDCGLKGLSGLSADVRILLESDTPAARFAIDYFVYRIALAAGALAAALGGIDAFVFTAGIGENAPAIRAAVLRRLEWLGLVLDDDANASGASRISTPESRVACFVIPTDEEAMIARHTVDTLDEHGLVTALGVAG